MPLAKCVRCNNLFDKLTNPVCPACVPEEESDFDKVRAVLDDHPDLGAEALAEMADVSVPLVMRMLDQGLVTNTSLSGTSTKCGRCGAPAISASKKLCHSCLEKLNQNVMKQKHKIALSQSKEVEVGGASSVRKMLEEKRR